MPLNIFGPLFGLALLTTPPVGQAVQNNLAPLPAQTAKVGPTQGAWQPVVQGKLKNGLRYAILPRQANEPGVGLFVRVKGGFIAERRPGERGLAHLIEHLVFRSPTRTAPDEMDRFRKIGFPLTFQDPAGGTTSWRESDYFVVSRTNRLTDLDALLRLYREVMSELVFRADAVDIQRADVMREMADKKLGNDIYASYIAAVAPGSPTDVIDAQNSDDVPTASVETIRGLYERIYRPENTSIVVVGDVDPSQIEALIAKRFGDWRGAGPKPGPIITPAFQSDRIVPISHSALKYGRNSAMMTVATPLSAPHKSRVEQANAMLMDLLAVRAVNARLATTRANYRPGKFGFYIENGEHGHRLLMAWDDFVPGQWQPAITDLISTICALKTAGLTDAEWQAAKENLLRELQQRADNMAQVSNFELSRDLSNSLTYGGELIPPDELLRHAHAFVASFNAVFANAWWRAQWLQGAEHIRVESPALYEVRDPDTVVRTLLEKAFRDSKCNIRRS